MKKENPIFAILMLIISIITCVAAVLVVPEFRTTLGLDDHSQNQSVGLTPAITNNLVEQPTIDTQLTKSMVSTKNIEATSTPQLLASPISSDCGNQLYVREDAKENETKTFIRCPIGEVQYSIQVDDILESITLICPNEPPQVIDFRKDETRSSSQLLPTYSSDQFRSSGGCFVQITVVSSIEKIGYTVWQEVISP